MGSNSESYIWEIRTPFTQTNTLLIPTSFTLIIHFLGPAPIILATSQIVRWLVLYVVAFGEEPSLFQ